MLQYSVTNKVKNKVELNSIKKPAINSDSDSAKSKGILFVSARTVVNKIKEL